ncbi:DNA-binding transcriptional response regulator, NtrC family, contains REC, AAA-type ATPase, and a Fis-type DNA-binding domains [Formivibrio citricus]|uniref:DNA-binding transcriptional response regulator, NtrC family, contains REC, AAA-type ATPase, and a Fis-type DNA-binding domains n=1 Tax=Formivibrio citricus TaxID=83765 RepID=A0A1I4XY35_9NEIS|nr:sigma-54 dependent transcriptional regulator [Formivibrio citricus]SFN30818.1 DNA-binding transcriptional response regulator, NtrC family, contains REC, AAA-type ATPase, and a Fis-type DNA-binding domains [Formivibrio citricus]
MAKHEILIVDDEVGIRELLSEILQDEGYAVATAENATAARNYRNQTEPRLVLLDIWMPDTDGVTLLKEWSRNGQLTMPVIMMSGHATIDTAVEATRIGALDFLEKPIGLQKLFAAVKRAFSHQGTPSKPQQGLSSLGSSGLIRELQNDLDKVRAQTLPVLLTGEPGVGFEACARYLTAANAPFIAPLSHEELALAPQELLQKAAGGTLFLRDIAYMEHKAQTGLLSILSKLEKSRVRLVSATSRPLLQLSSQLDAELLRQATQLIVPVPPLRDHPGDIPALAENLLAQAVASNRLGPRRFSNTALQALAKQRWPGNVDQLANVVKSLALTGRDGEIDVNHVNRLLAQLATPDMQDELPSAPIGQPMTSFDLDLPLREARDQFERYYLERQIDLAGGNMSRVAERIGLERTHLYRKLKQLGIQMPKKFKNHCDE